MNKVKVEKYINEAMTIKLETIENSAVNKWPSEYHKHFEKFPRKLYKYTKINKYYLDSIKNNYIYLCPANILDDQFECRINFDVKKINENPNLLVKQLIDGIIDNISDYPDKLVKSEIKEKAYKVISEGYELDFDKMKDELIDIIPSAKIEDIDCYISYLKKMVDGILKDRGNDYLKELIEKAFVANQRTGIGSLTENNKSQVMWEMYANHYKGICIEYDFTNEYQSMIDILPVVYGIKNKDNFILILVNIVIDSLMYHFSSGALNNLDNIKKFVYLYLTKYNEWSFQKEWRIIGEAASKYKVKKIKSIYLGKNISKTNREKIIKIARKKGINLYQQIDDFDSLSIKYKKITSI